MRPVGVLSGGERARVALAMLVLRPSNVLLLDEPTNHLDLASGEALVTALAAFEGAMVLVTHDRWLVEAVATHVAWVVDGALVIREGVADLEPPERVAGPSTRAESDGARAHEERRRRAREIDKAKRRIVVIERELPKLEARVAALLEAGFAAAADHVRARAIDAERAGLQAQIDALYAEWADLDVVASS
jgi:ATP-binding cassette subfamily F protein 3